MDLVTMLFIESILIGAFGGLISYIFVKKRWRDVRPYSLIRKTLLGACAALLYFYAITDYNFPNHVATFFVGYFAESFISKLSEQYQYRLKLKQTQKPKSKRKQKSKEKQKHRIKRV